MISYLSGTILEKAPQFVIIENAGVGYKVFVTPTILEKRIGDTISIYTYLKISDDGHTLFGVPDFHTLQFFELLITVSGVGPKIALAMLAAASVDTLESAISNADIDIFTRMSGVGRKTAERIILELKNKIGTLATAPTTGTSDIYDALINLGFKQNEVRTAISQLDPTASSEEQLKAALKLLGK